MFKSLLQSFLLAGLACAGTVVWDGRFNDMSSATDLDNWSWSNEVGPYQWYIHGSGATTDYVNLSSAYKNPADTSSAQGVKMTINPTSLWNGQTMWRTELIPQTTANIGTGSSGTMYYHLSISRSATNPPVADFEHQVCFFESHFTELKYGWVNGQANVADPTLKWDIGGVTQWSTAFDAGVWHNFVYAIDFSANTVGMWHSTGGDNLVQVIAPKSASTSSNSADWHLGVLRLPQAGDGATSTAAEDWYFSGVYIETGDLTTSVSGPGGAAASSSSTSSVATKTTTAPGSTSTGATSTTSSATATSTGAAAAKYGQCGGIGWTGATACVSGSTCTMVNTYYYQCL